MQGGGCLDALCCCWCQQSRQHNLMKTGFSGVDFVSCMCSFVGDLVCFGVTVGTGVLAFTIRQKIRARYLIDGGCCGDCFASFFCPWCVISQHYREMCMHGEWPDGTCVSEPFFHPDPPQVMGEQHGAEMQEDVPPPYGQQFSEDPQPDDEDVQRRTHVAVKSV
jgi:Cys-rich protein (TIGR01571 family)